MKFFEHKKEVDTGSKVEKTEVGVENNIDSQIEGETKKMESNIAEIEKEVQAQGGWNSVIEKVKNVIANKAKRIKEETGHLWEGKDLRDDLIGMGAIGAAVFLVAIGRYEILDLKDQFNAVADLPPAEEMAKFMKEVVKPAGIGAAIGTLRIAVSCLVTLYETAGVMLENTKLAEWKRKKDAEEYARRVRPGKPGYGPYTDGNPADWRG